MIIAGLFMMMGTQAQTATNFNCKDCSGKDYDLFTELDAGKVVVLCWVMPCSSCILPATTAYNVAKSYASTHPGMVQMYVIDDYANTSCNDINNWCHVYGLDSTVRFSNKAINMKDYGTDGMPKTVVVSGTWHKVYFNQNNAVNAANLQAAIDLALTETSVDEKVDTRGNKALVLPNPMKGSGKIEITVEKPEQVMVSIYDVNGRNLKQLQQDLPVAGSHTIGIPVTDLSAGIYFAHIRAGSWVIVEKFIVEQ